MIVVEVLKAFESSGSFSVSGDNLVDGAPPQYFEQSSQIFLEVKSGATLEDYFLYELASYGNQLGIMAGTGLLLLSRDDQPRSDTQCDLNENPNLDTEEPEKDSVDYLSEKIEQTSAIAPWLIKIKAWLKSQPDLESAQIQLKEKPGGLFSSLPPGNFATGLYNGMLLVDLVGRSEVLEEEGNFDSIREDAPRPEWLKLSFDKAIAYFKAKVPIPTVSYKDMADNYHDVAFSVTNLTKADILEDVKWLVERAIADGDSLEVFNRRWNRLIARKGWKVGGVRRKLIYDTNIRSAYSRGREQQMRDPDVLSRRPYWITRGGDSVSPRPHHAVLDNKAIAADNAFWKVAGGPIWGFNCKCKIFSASEDYLKRNNIEILEKPPDPKTIAEPGFRKGLLAEGANRDKILEDAIAKLDPAMQEVVKKSVDQNQ